MLNQTVTHTVPSGRLVLDRVNRRTGHRVVLIDADTSDDFSSDEGGRWVLYCCGHGGFVQVDAQHPAREIHGSPWEWCEDCQRDRQDADSFELSERVRHAQQPKRLATAVQKAGGEPVTETTLVVESRPGGLRVASLTPTGETTVWASEIETYSEARRRAETISDMCGYPIRDLCAGMARTDDPDLVAASYGRSWHREVVA